MPIDQKTFDSLKGLWELVGGPAGFADVAASVAFAESGGCQYALAGPLDIRPVKICVWNQTSGENSCGYWQINLWAHPSYSAPSIFDAYTNARAALAISNHGTDFGAWSTYVNGAYLAYLRQFGGQGIGPPPPPASSDDGNAVGLTWASGWNHFSRALGRGLPANLARSQHYRRAALRRLSSSRRVR